MNDFIRTFDDVKIEQQDIAMIKGIMNTHRADHVLDYHGYLDLKTTLRFPLAKKLKEFASKVGLRLAGIYAFTAHPNSLTSIHLDGDVSNGPLPWRLSFYAEGGPGLLSWYSNDIEPEFNKKVGAFVYDQDLPLIFEKRLDMPAAFVRTDIPHRLDTTGTVSDRLTITATFSPAVSWEELNHRLDLYEQGKNL